MPPVSPFHPHARQRRALLALGVILAVILTLGAAFFRTQVVHSSAFVLRADNNRFREVPIPAPRGTIFDREGRIIAETITGYSLIAEAGPVDSLRLRVASVAPLLGLDSAGVEAVLARGAEKPKDPVVITDTLSFAQLSRLQENPVQLPGIVLDARPIRRYPHGKSVSHLVGYVSEISAAELKNERWSGYRMGHSIGKSGIERQYESTLGGRAGARFVEVDARGRIVGRFAEQLTTPPTPGEDLRLTIDLDLQRYARRIFPIGMRGAVVALEPETGEVLAMYSSPTYDPNLLVGRIRADVWRGLNSDPGRPLLNRVTDGIYPPGSTWKLATAMVGLEKKIITPTERMPISCTGGMSYKGRYSRCWKKDGHGPQDLIRAIGNSCNVYFYQLGIRLGINLLTREGTRLGFSRPTRIDLPGEKPGTFPVDREWYKRRFGWYPPPSEVMNLAIGQGPNSQTPLRMAQFFSAIAGNGKAPAPRLSRGAPVGADPETDLNLAPSTLEAVREGLAAVIEPGGTAHAVELKRWKLYGKTGTSQNPHDPRRPHGWFTGFAGPRGDLPPEIAIAVLVEFGESGSAAAAPIASRLADFYLNRKHGLRSESIDSAAPVQLKPR